MAGVVPIELECPVCHDDFEEPKILPCTHLVCQKCVVTWLKKGGQEAGCPLCRSSIISPSGQNDITTLVNALPTDLATMALVESSRVLFSPHVCTMCQNNVTARSYCCQCEVKLCPTCVTDHQKFPALKDHTLEKLGRLTTQQLVASHRSKCNSHSDRLAEFYCSSHQELLCALCSSTNHRGCPDVKAITEVAEEKRAELGQEAQRLRDEEAEMTAQVETIKNNLKATSTNADDVFDDIQQTLENQRQKVKDMMEKEEKVSVTSLANMEKVRAALKSHAGTIDHLVTSAPDDSLLQMLKQLRSRLDDLKGQRGKIERVKTDILFDAQLLTRLKADLCAVGTSMTAEPNTDRQGGDRELESKFSVTTDSNRSRECVVYVTPDFRECCHGEDGALAELRKHLGNNAEITYTSANTIRIKSTSSEVIQRASKAIHTCLKCAWQKLWLKQRTEDRAKTQQGVSTQLKYTEEFVVREDLVGLAIGIRGANIRQARWVDNVLSVQLDGETGIVTVEGKTMEAVKKARGMLEFLEELYVLPGNLADRLIGTKGYASIIQEIANDSGVVRMTFPDEEEMRQKDEVSIIILGTPETIHKAKLLLEFHVDLLKATPTRVAELSARQPRTSRSLGRTRSPRSSRERSDNFRKTRAQ